MMKKMMVLLLALGVATTSFSCREKTTAEKIEDSLKKAGKKLEEAGEELEDAADEAGKALEEEAEKLADDLDKKLKKIK